MFSAKKYKIIAILGLILSLMIAAVAVIGVFFRGDMSAVEVVSVRGEKYQMIADGVYRYNAQRMVAEGAGWDIFTLFVAVPAMLIILPLLARGSQKGRLLAIGLLAYFFYQYLMYALAWAFGPLFLPFVAIYACSLLLGLWLIADIDIGELRRKLSGIFPRRGLIVLSLLLAVMLIFMWLQRIIAGLRGDLQTAMLLGQTTMVIQALDLGLIVPLALITGITVWREQPLGYLLSPIVMVKAVAMAGAICAMLISAWIVEGSPEIVTLLIFGAVLLAAAYLGFRILQGLD